MTAIEAIGGKKRAYDVALSRLTAVMSSSPKGSSWSIPFISGIGAGVVSTLICNPFDVAKVRLQVQGAHPISKLKYYGTFSTLRTIVREEGFAGAFKGIGQEEPLGLDDMTAVSLDKATS